MGSFRDAKTASLVLNSLDHMVVNVEDRSGSTVSMEHTNAWLIARHPIWTPDLQRIFLALLSEAAASGDVPKKQAALLTDRVRLNEG